jgi:Sulfatase-modifying factor enzyme 1/PKD domain/Fn3 associated/Chitobiase/beta-hexosaminidase C-terminal domain
MVQKFLLVILLTSVMAMSVFAAGKNGKDTVPSWLDTIAPIVKADPLKRLHSSMFYIKLTSNERAQIWYSLNTPDSMRLFNSPEYISKDGEYNLYYYAEDDFANKSKVESIQYILDQRPPSLMVTPNSGLYPSGTVVRLKTDEKCRFLLMKSSNDTTGTAITDSIPLKNEFSGYIAAIDMCGNRSVSDYVKYQIDTAKVVPVISPGEGVYRLGQKISFSNIGTIDVFYSFDPVQPAEWFTRYDKPATLPYGTTIVRFYGKNKAGTNSEIFRTKFTIDTIPPKIISRIGKGPNADTIILSTRDQSPIRYEINKMIVNNESPVYSGPIIIAHKGKATVRASARDEAGNESEGFKWEGKWDLTPPLVQVSSNGGSFTKQQKVFVTANEPVKVFYTLDGSTVTQASLLYNAGEGILISREDSTLVRLIAYDFAENASVEKTIPFFIDSRPPQVRVRINGSMQDGKFLVSLIADEESKIYYATGGADPSYSSSQYAGPFTITTGTILKYFAVDKSGNRSNVLVMDELVRPRVEAVPNGGLYNKKLKITFATNTSGTVHWRLLPDTLFQPLTDTIVLDEEGVYSLEYYIESKDGLISPLRRNEYTIDWTAPYVQISIKKGVNDSVIVFFDASENASIYYTIDGSNPLYSQTAKTAGNKFLQSKDRIVVPRTKNSRLAFYAEDIARNQSAISILDVMSPKAVPNVPAGSDKMYDRILSISLNTPDQSIIYYCRHGNTPTSDSTVYTEPVTLMQSDTILAFVVDASGYKGQVDTFIYHIDLPPIPQFRVTSDSLVAGKTVVFDANESIDKETPFDKLQFRWDFDGDGNYDTEKGSLSKVTHVYPKAGNYSVTLEITDWNKRIATISRVVAISAICPSDMISVNKKDGNNFCIDKYEWPNVDNEQPQTGVSWVEAKMSCIDAGKRLCTAEEWETACRGIDKTVYPYGNKYLQQKCATEGKIVYKSGSFKNCNNFHVEDMTGNVWEWVEDKHGDYPLMYG